MASLKTSAIKMDDPRIVYHALEREVGDLASWGFPFPLPEGTQVAMGKAILAVAAADGKLTARERTFLVGRARMFGANDEELAEIAAFDPKTVPLDALIDAVPPAARRLVLYDAVMVSRSDGFGEKERVAAVKMAQRLGLSAEYVDALEAHFIAEDGIRDARIRLVTDTNA